MNAPYFASRSQSALDDAPTVTASSVASSGSAVLLTARELLTVMLEEELVALVPDRGRAALVPPAAGALHVRQRHVRRAVLHARPASLRVGHLQRRLVAARVDMGSGLRDARRFL